MYKYELFLEGEGIDRYIWEAFIKRLEKYDKNITLEILFQANNIEFYLQTRRDLSALATLLEGFVLKPSEINNVSDSEYFAKSSFRLSSKKNILDIRESEEIKKGRIIKKILITPKSLLNIKYYYVGIYMEDKYQGNLCSAYFSLNNPLNIFELNFKDNIKLKKKSVPTFLKIDETTKILVNDPSNSILEVSGFPYFSQKVFLPLGNFEFAKHSLIVGQTGVGKSKFIELFIKNVAKLPNSNEYALVIIDPHASLYPQFEKLESTKKEFNFIDNSCNLFPTFSEPKISTELTILLFKTLLKEQFNAKMERVLKYTVYTLLLKKQMSLSSVRKFLTDLNFRKSVLEGLEDQYFYIIQFFGTEFIEFQTKFYEMSIMPVLVLIDELNFVPAFSNQLAEENLESCLQNNFLTCFSLNRIFLGEKATRLIAGLIIQQLFLIAQKREINKKIILIIDEVSTVENESLTSILSEARKFNLSLFLAQQYLTQVTPQLLNGILSNTSNYYVFKMSDEDAKTVSKNLDLSFPDEIMIKQKEKGLSDEDLKRNLLVTLNPRECIVRVFAQGKFYPCFKAKTLDI